MGFGIQCYIVVHPRKNTWYIKVINVVLIHVLCVAQHMINFVLLVVIAIHKFRLVKSIKEKVCMEQEKKDMLRLINNQFHQFYAFWAVYGVSFLPTVCIKILYTIASVTSDKYPNILQLANNVQICVFLTLYDSAGNVIMTFLNTVILIRSKLVWGEIANIGTVIRTSFSNLRYQPRYEVVSSENDIVAIGSSGILTGTHDNFLYPS